MRIYGETVNLSLHKSTLETSSWVIKNQDITEGLIARVMKETKGIEATLPFHGWIKDDAMALWLLFR